MPAPVLMVVDEDANGLRRLKDTLRSRYGHDYLMIGESSVATALTRLRDLRAAGEPVAVVMTGAAMTVAAAAEFLCQARTIHPTAKRALVVQRGDSAEPNLRVPVPLVADPQAATPVLRAIAHGMIDAYLSDPGATLKTQPRVSSSRPSSSPSCAVSSPGQLLTSPCFTGGTDPAQTST